MVSKHKQRTALQQFSDTVAVCRVHGQHIDSY